MVLALEEAIENVCVITFSHGDAVLDYVFRREPWVSRAAGSSVKLIFLDIETPGTTAGSVIEQIRAVDPPHSLSHTPVVIFTDSQSPQHVRELYRCGANSYIEKPVDFCDFLSLVGTVGQYWMSHNRAS